jgi:hypothetical protein
LKEFYLQRNGYFPRELWKVWEVDIKKFLAHPATRREWARLRDSFRDDAEFYAFVEQGQHAGDLT